MGEPNFYPTLPYRKIFLMQMTIFLAQKWSKQAILGAFWAIFRGVKKISGVSRRTCIDSIGGGGALGVTPPSAFDHCPREKIFD